jgi:hypothetical protein
MKSKILSGSVLVLLMLALGISLFSLYLAVKLETEIDDLHSTLNSLSTDKISTPDLDFLIELHDDLESRISELESTKTVVLDASSKYYERIDTDMGFFFIRLLDVRQFLDGYKLVFNIGNPTSAIYRDFSLTIKWGKKYQSEEWKSVIEWMKSLQSKSESFTSDLKPGHWNKVEIIISPARPDELGYIEISMKTNEFGLD